MFDVESISNISKCRECADVHGYLVPIDTKFLRNAYDLEYSIIRKPAYFCLKCLCSLGFLRDIKPAIPKEVTADKPKKKVVKVTTNSMFGGSFMWDVKPGL